MNEGLIKMAEGYKMIAAGICDGFGGQERAGGCGESA